MFRITKIKIYPGCTGRKNLQEEEYQFLTEDSGLLPDGFFGKNIMVSAIVGKNGSGKSSILDIIYRVLNNACAILCTNLNTEKETAFYFIKKVHADIYYKDRNNNDCSIKCHDDSLWIQYTDGYGRERRYHFGKDDYQERDYDHKDKVTELERADILNHLFYCSVVNYAPFTLNSKEYAAEDSVKVGKNLLPEAFPLGNPNWMQSIFHKNDGYQSCITITPFRDKGKFDASKEANLVKGRLLSILAVHRDLIDGYVFSKASFNILKLSFRDKFSMTRPSEENGYSPKMDIEAFASEFQDRLIEYVHNGKESVASRILKELGYKKENLKYLDEPYLYSYLYLVYKVLSCAHYPIFSRYRDLNDTDLAISINNDPHLLDKVTNLTNEVKCEHSHITFKIERTKQFIEMIPTLAVSEEGFGEVYHFNLDDYPTKDDISDTDIISAQRLLPPSFFNVDLYFSPKYDKFQEVRFEHLSSGERLFYTAISSVIYHTMNILSITGMDRVAYREMLVVLDEMELCFHPDYQRTFLNKLINVLKRLKFNRYMDFHILVTTHSPFILSDIPMSSILFLKEGKTVDPAKDRIINPYGANINDILCQSFFLKEDGFIGEHARQTILSLYDYLAGEHTEGVKETDIKWDEPTARQVIDLIGEPLIKESLLSLFRTKFKTTEDIRRQIAALQKELEDMEESR